MVARTRITDPHDERLDPVRALRATERALRAQGLVIAESPLTIERVLAVGHPLELLVGTPGVLDRLSVAVEAGAGRRSPVVVEVTQDVLDAAVGFPLHRGAVALARPRPRLDAPSIVAAGRRLAILEGVNDLENLGVILRAATGLGLDGVLLGPGCGDPWSRRAIRVSVGTALDLPWAPLEPWPAALGEVRRAGYRLAALSPAGTVDVATPEWRSAERLAVLLGAEGPGLTEEVLAAADVTVRIPMAHAVDSLNVASAAAIAFHAVVAGDRAR